MDTKRRALYNTLETAGRVLPSAFVAARGTLLTLIDKDAISAQKEALAVLLPITLADPTMLLLPSWKCVIEMKYRENCM